MSSAPYEPGDASTRNRFTKLRGLLGATAPQKALLPVALDVLLVDDTQEVLDGLKRILGAKCRSWSVVCARSGEEAIEIMQSRNFDAVVCDMYMPDMRGVDVLRWVSEERPSTRRIALTGYADESWKLRDKNIAETLLMKPCSPLELIAAIDGSDGFVWALDGPVARKFQRDAVNPAHQRGGRNFEEQAVEWK